MSNDTSPEINCLRCRFCQLLPHSDFGKAVVPIHCAKTGRNRPAHITDGCKMAIPKPRYSAARGAGRWTGSRVGRGETVCGGDKTIHASAVEIAYLREHYPVAPQDQITAATGRSWVGIKRLATVNGLRRSITARQVQKSAACAKEGRIKAGKAFNAAQSAFIHDRYRSGPWPIRGGSNAPEHRAQRQALQNEIVEAVAALGPRWEWRAICLHVRWTSPGYRRYLKQRKAKRAAAKEV